MVSTRAGIIAISCSTEFGKNCGKIRVDREGCIGCGVCEALCGEVFRLTEDGKSSITEENRKQDSGHGEVGNDLVACVENAEDSCPVSVIKTE